MTLAEFFSMPAGWLPEDWEKELKRRKRLERRLSKASDKFYDCELSLDVLIENPYEDPTRQAAAIEKRKAELEDARIKLEKAKKAITW